MLVRHTLNFTYRQLILALLFEAHLEYFVNQACMAEKASFSKGQRRSYTREEKLGVDLNSNTVLCWVRSEKGIKEDSCLLLNLEFKHTRLI